MGLNRYSPYGWPMTSVEFNREKPMAGLGIQLSTGEKSEWLALVNSVILSREFPMAGLGAQWSSIENPQGLFGVCVELLI